MTARSRCPNRLEDATLSVTCYYEIFIFSAHQYSSHLMPLCNNPLCPAVPFHLFLIFLETLGVVNALPRQGCCSTSRPWHTPAAAAPPACSSMLCPVLRTSCARQCAALFCHAFSILIHFYFKPPRIWQGEKNLQFS